MMEVTVPPTHRWIPKGMTVQYLEMAKSDLVATATPRTRLDVSEANEFQVDVAVRDEHGQTVFAAAIAMWITPRKGYLRATR